MADTAQVIAHIRGLHQDVANVQAHSQWLQDFQQVHEAWAVVRELLGCSEEELVQYFAAQTLVTKLQAGQPPTPNGGSVLQELMQYLSRYQRGPPPVRRQLVVALVDYALWRPAAEDSAWLTDCVQKLSASNESLPCLLELLTVIPEEAANRKVVVEAQRRSSFALSMLQHTSSALDALWKASQTEPSATVAVLVACGRWLHLQHASPALRAQKRAGGGAGSGAGPFCADLVKHGGLHQHPLLLKAAQTVSNIGSAHIELCRASADVLSEAHALTNDTSPQAQPLQLIILQAVVAGSQQLLPATQENLETWMPPDTELAQRVAVLGRLVGELGGMFARLTVAVGASAASGGTGDSPQAQELVGILGNLSEVALHFCALRSTDLAKCGLDFWYMVLSQHLGALTEEDDVFDEDAGPQALGRPLSDAWAGNRGADQDADLQRRADEKPFLAPPVQRMVEAHWRAVRYPAEPELQSNFEWDEFVRFREMCAINVTEACLIVTPRWIIEYVGQVLEKTCATAPIAWQDIDACVFLLTAVASRAPAGQDTVIPRLIGLLPELPYPTEGFKATLLRCAASRLVLFTSGYLALNPEPCKLILRFLVKSHLPCIPGLSPGPDPDAKKYSEALACDAMKMVMTAARKVIVAADGGTLWKFVISEVIGLVADSRFNVDCRAQLVFGIGQVLSVLDNWDELEQMLGQFVSRMQVPLQPIFERLPAEPLGAAAQKQTRDGKAPLELKLYIAALSSVYNMPVRSTDVMNRPDHHPVLAVVEQHFPTIERICIHHSQYEELMEQVCLAFSYILGFAREYAPTSPVFVPMMKLMARCCEYHPQPFYLGLVRSVIGFFAVGNDNDMHRILVDLTGLFIHPVISRLAAATAGNGQPLSTAINAAGFEMLSEAMRHWNLALMAMQSAAWLPEVFDATIRVLPFLSEANQVVHERTISSMLRFVRNMLLWADPDTRKGDNAPELLELQNQAQGMLQERPLPNGVALPRIATVLAQLLASAAPHGPSKGEVVPAVADVMQKFFSGPFEYVISSQLPSAFRALAPPLNAALTDIELQRLIQQLKMERGDARRFARSIIGVAENFAVCLKKAQFR